jgi:type II secretory ATPase GspE/PulE/Tfp pilus assembly ATPase PilB-like protein
LEKQYDFATFEPSENYVKIIFRKDKVVKETKYIKYPTYTNILFKAKSITKLTIEESKDEQE